MSATWARSRCADLKPLKLIDYVTTNASAKLKIGQAHYSGLLYDHGGFVDDILVHKVADDHYFLCVNASNQEKDFEHIAARKPVRSRRRVRERPLCPDRRAGAASAATLAEADTRSTGADQVLLVCRWRGARYSGAHRAHRLHGRGWVRDLHPARRGRADLGRTAEAGAEFGIKPCGLGARNTLRLESKMALYGHEIDASITPSKRTSPGSSSSTRAISSGREALAEAEGRGCDSASLAGFEMRGRGIGRDGYEVYVDGEPRDGSPAVAIADDRQEHRTLLSPRCPCAAGHERCRS